MKKKFLFASLFFATIASAQQTHLKIDIKKGQQLQSVAHTNTDVTIAMMGQNMENNSESAVTSSVAVKDITDTGYVFSNTIKHVTMHVSSMGQEMNFDSDKQEDMDGQMGAAFKGRINNPQDITVDKDGIITSMGDDSSDAAGMMMNSMATMFKGQPYPLLLALPSGKVKPGDSWIDSTGNEEEAMKMINTYTLKGVTDSGLVIAYVGTIIKKGTMQMGEAQIEMDLKGNVKGESTYDSSTGILRKNTGAVDMKGTMTMMGQDVPISSKVISTTVVTGL